MRRASHLKEFCSRIAPDAWAGSRRHRISLRWDVGERMLGAGRPVGVVSAHDQLRAAAQVVAVLHVTGGGVAAIAAADDRGIRGEVDRHPPVEDVERALPETGVSELLAIPGDAAVELIDLVETTVQHQARQHFTADAAGAVGDNRLVLEVVVGAAVQLGDELTGVADRGNHGIREPSDLGFEGVATVEEGDVFLCDQFVQLLRGEPGAAADDPVLVDLQFAGSAEADQFVAHPHAETGEVVAATVTPLHVEVLERGVFARLAQVLLHIVELTADGAVDAVLRDEDAPTQPERLAQVALPQPDRLGVGERGEDVVEQDLGDGHCPILNCAPLAVAPRSLLGMEAIVETGTGEAGTAVRTRYAPGHPVDLGKILSPLFRSSRNPSCQRDAAGIWLTQRTPEGPASLRLTQGQSSIAAVAWGAGAEWTIARVPQLLGAEDNWSELDVSGNAFLADARRRSPGLRLLNTGLVLEALIPAIIEQKVTTVEAWRAWRTLLLDRKS